MAKKKSTQLMYAVLETHYEYDDNYYNATEGYSSPRALYKSEEKARKACHASNEDFVLSSNFITYLNDGVWSFMQEDGIKFMEQFKDLITPIQIHNEEEESMEVDFSTIKESGSHEDLERFVRYFQTVYRLLPANDERREQMIEFVQTVPYSVHEVQVED